MVTLKCSKKKSIFNINYENIKFEDEMKILLLHGHSKNL